jgi:hypothetical protein
MEVKKVEVLTPGQPYRGTGAMQVIGLGKHLGVARPDTTWTGMQTSGFTTVSADRFECELMLR